MPMWHETMDEVAAIERDNQLSVDQQLKAAEIRALLTIAQELSTIHHEGIASYSGRTE